MAEPVTDSHKASCHSSLPHIEAGLVTFATNTSSRKRIYLLEQGPYNSVSGVSLLQDPSLSEALFYLHVLAVAASDNAHEVVAATPGLQDALKHMVATLGEIRLLLQ
jgi:hypothetical protein